MGLMGVVYLSVLVLGRSLLLPIYLRLRWMRENIITLLAPYIPRTATTLSTSKNTLNILTRIVDGSMNVDVAVNEGMSGSNAETKRSEVKEGRHENMRANSTYKESTNIHSSIQQAYGMGRWTRLNSRWMEYPISPTTNQST